MQQIYIKSMKGFFITSIRVVMGRLNVLLMIRISSQSFAGYEYIKAVREATSGVFLCVFADLVRSNLVYCKYMIQI